MDKYYIRKYAVLEWHTIGLGFQITLSKDIQGINLLLGPLVISIHRERELNTSTNHIHGR